MWTPAATMSALMIAAAGAPQPAPSSEGQRASLPALLARADAAALAASRDWQVLLHYRPTMWGGWKSDADGDGFFLAGPTGRRDPQAELHASLTAFLADGPPGDQHAQCRFPARWAWLKTALAIEPGTVIDQACPTFTTWHTGISASAATLIYASAYVNSPASMYGHTFLRLSRATAESNPLLDYIVNFAADVDTSNGLLYALKGTTGGFAGRFYVMPYYVKVQEYSNLESRDLWEYRLTFTAAQVDRLVMHAWETRTTQFSYYFFSRNCSYQLLSLLEVADPSLHLMEQFSGTVIPVDTLRAVLAQPGLVEGRSERPSLLIQLKRRSASLSTEEMDSAEALSRPPAKQSPTADPAAALGRLPVEQQARVIDAAYDYLRYRDGENADTSDTFKHQERQLLVQRGRLGVADDALRAEIEAHPPEDGHATLRVGVGGGASNQVGTFETISLRGALHDYLDPDAGYPENAELTMADVRLRVANRRRSLELDRVDAVNIVSASPLDRFAKSGSWKFWLGADNARELGCGRAAGPGAGWRCLYAGAITGGGVAIRFGGRQRWLAMLLAEADVGVGPAFSGRHDVRAGAGGEALLTGSIGPRWRLEADLRAAYYVLGPGTPNLRARVGQSFVLSPSWSLRASGDVFGPYRQATLDLMVYR